MDRSGGVARQVSDDRSLPTHALLAFLFCLPLWEMIGFDVAPDLFVPRQGINNED